MHELVCKIETRAGQVRMIMITLRHGINPTSSFLIVSCGFATKWEGHEIFSLRYLTFDQ